MEHRFIEVASLQTDDTVWFNTAFVQTISRSKGGTVTIVYSNGNSFSVADSDATKIISWLSSQQD